MKEETKVITTNVYIANDGKEFECADDCLAWDAMLETEKEKAEKIKAASDLLLSTVIESMGSFEPISLSSVDTAWCWFKIQTKEELEALAFLSNACDYDFLSDKNKEDVTFPCVLYAEYYHGDWMLNGNEDKKVDVIVRLISDDLLYVTKLLGALEQEGLAMQIVSRAKEYYDNEKFKAMEKAIVLKLLPMLSSKDIAEVTGWRKEEVYAARKEAAET